MNFLRKISLIVVISLSAESMGAVFDLPPETPGLQNRGATLVHPHNGIQCIKVTVNGHNIYFPRDGSQPTTPEAVEYSCANIDNRENSPITEWYMKMFGVIPINHAAIAAGGAGAPALTYVQAGWDNAGPNAGRIISFDVNFNNADIVKDPDSEDLVSREDFFVQKFRRIASTSVGRTLLYRLLIEIRRHQIGGNIGCLENGIDARHLLTHRNNSRTLRIRWGRFVYGYTYIAVENFIMPLPTIGKNDNGYNHIVKYTPSLDIVLFHEMNHWYHHLRHPNRYVEEENYYDIGRRLDGNQTMHHGRMVTGEAAAILGLYYWQGLLAAGPQLDVSEKAWSNPTMVGVAQINRVPFEEMRNILGVPPTDIRIILNLANDPQFDLARRLNGDELSENLYRICIGAPLRYGYWQSPTQSSTCYEDSKIIDKVVASCTSYKGNYNCIPVARGKVDYEWGNLSNEIGLGNFRIFFR